MAMSDYDRKLIFDVAGGIESNLWHIHQIYGEAGYKNGTAMLEWLRSRGIIGPSFSNLVKDHGSSKLRVGSYILKKMEHVKERPIYARDLK